MRRSGAERSKAGRVALGFRSIEWFSGASIASVRPKNHSMPSRAPFGGCERSERPPNVELTCRAALQNHPTLEVNHNNETSFGFDAR